MLTLAHRASATLIDKDGLLLVRQGEVDVVAGGELHEVVGRELVARTHAAAVLVRGLAARCSARRVRRAARSVA